MSRLNLIGWPKLTAGIGEHIRSVSKALMHDKNEIFIYDVLAHCFNDPSIFSNQEVELDAFIFEGSLENNVSLHCLNLNHLTRLPKSYFEAKYNIGYGYYEMSYLMDEFIEGAKLLDEIWAPTQFIQKVLSKQLDIPVIHMPIPLQIGGERKNILQRLGLNQNTFWFYCSFDARSMIERKNPLAIISAFKQAFSTVNSDVGLVIKVNASANSKEQMSTVKTLKDHVDDDPRIKLINKVMERDEILDLFYSVDCYVSLHRAEGLGLGMSESMSLGTAVIATGYSGNLDFMNARNSALVGYEYVVDTTCEKINRRVAADEKFYWAEADVDDAADKMLKMFLDRKYRSKLIERAKTDIDRFYSIQEISKSYSKRLELIEKTL